MNFTEAEKRLLLENSIERVLNNALWVGDVGMKARDPVVSERAGILVDDVAHLKPLVDKLWREAQEIARS